MEDFYLKKFHLEKKKADSLSHEIRYISQDFPWCEKYEFVLL